MQTTVGNVLIGSGDLQAVIVPPGGGGAAFTSLGGFRDGLSINMSEDRVNVESQDSLGFVKSVRSRAEMTITTSLLESTLSNLNFVLRGNDAAGVPTATTSIQLTADPSDSEPNHATPMKFIGDSTDGGLKTWTFSSVVPVLDGDLTYSKDSELLIPVTFMCLAVKSAANTWGFGWVLDG